MNGMGWPRGLLFLAICGAGGLLFSMPGLGADPVDIVALRVGRHPDMVRVVLDLTGPLAAQPHLSGDGRSIRLALPNARWRPPASRDLKDYPPLTRLAFDAGAAVLIIDAERPLQGPRIQRLPPDAGNPHHRIALDLRAATAPATPAAKSAPVAALPPAATTAPPPAPVPIPEPKPAPPPPPAAEEPPPPAAAPPAAAAPTAVAAAPAAVDIETLVAKARAELRKAQAASDPKAAKAHYEKARRWLQQAAEGGDAMAAFDLGQMHRLGLGKAPDLPAAATWYGRAAAQGFPPAQYNLGIMKLQGLSVPQDADAGVDLLERAAQQDYKPAMDILEQLQKTASGPESQGR